MRSFFTKFIFWILVFCSIVVKGQQVEWAKSMVDNTTAQFNLQDKGNSITTDASGNVYTIGKFSGLTDFDPGTGIYGLSPNIQDVFISKLNSNGNFVWAKKIDGTGANDNGNEVIVTNSGILYITGYFQDSADFNPGAGIYRLKSKGQSDLFVSKLDANGNFIWACSFGGVGNETTSSISYDSNGNLYITGNFEDTVDFDPSANVYNLISEGGSDAFACKLDMNGNFVWAKQLGGTNMTSCSDITLASSGNIYLGGVFSGTVDFDPGPGSMNLSTATYQGFYEKLDNNGNFLWAKAIGQECYEVKVDANENIYVTGNFKGSFDFDPEVNSAILTSVNPVGWPANQVREDRFICKMDSTGSFSWVKGISATGDEEITSFTIDSKANIYIAGVFGGTGDFSFGTGVYPLTSASGNTDIFVCKIDKYGGFLWAKNTACPGGYLECIAVNQSENFYITGSLYSNIDFDFSNAIYNLNSTGFHDVYVTKYKGKGILGEIFNDYNQNCSKEITESGLYNRTAIINPGSIVVTTNADGTWFIDSLAIGNYTISFDTSGNWFPTCPTTMNFTVSNPNTITNAPSFGLISSQPCVQPDITLSAPFLRRCFSNQMIYVQACNQAIATAALNSAFIEVELDSLLTPTSASISYISLGNNKYRFALDTLNPGQCSNFTINTTVSCDAMLNQTLCMEAQLFPADSCIFDTIPATPIPGDTVSVTPCNQPWDNSSLSVDGYCTNDTVYFTVINNGSNMLCNTPVRVFVNDTFTYAYSIILAAGQSITYSYASTGQTWILQADQHPLHPGNSHPNAHVEACGNLSNWTPNLVNNLPLDDADQVKDIYCIAVTGAYDPNDKTGFPTGIGTLHEVLPNQQIQYQIRFQNTGNDTAFKIVIRDTLDTDLNIFSVVPGVASHAYSFRMYGPRVLEWTFNNIMLPDSNINEPLSHGFATFRVDQQANLPNGTTILNDADIYFDFNEPIITNETVHTINNQLHNFAVGVKQDSKIQEARFIVYPNPANELLTIELLNDKSSNLESNIKIENVLGQVVYSIKTKQAKNSIDISKLTEGIYIITVENKNTKQSTKVIKL